jgi:hypothetical protein
MSPPGLTARDFHHQTCVNPLDVFPTRSRVMTRQNFKSPIRSQEASRSSSRLAKDHHVLTCYSDDEDEDEEARGGRAYHTTTEFDCCAILDHGNSDPIDFDHPSPICCDEPHHNSPSPMDCEDCVDDCDDCVEEHVKASQKPCHFVDGCQECHDENADACPGGPACRETCEDCDFSCFDCVDWTEFERDKSLGLSFSVPLLEDTSLPASETPVHDAFMSGSPSSDPSVTHPQAVAVPPIDIPMHHQCFQNTISYWDDMAYAQVCGGLPGLGQQLPLPPFTLSFGCHPAIAHQQAFQSSDAGAMTPGTQEQFLPRVPKPEPPLNPLDSTKDLLSAVDSPNTSKSCRWLMPCGTVCSASFATATDLKKHLKSVHLAKGVTQCRWQGCEAATFATEAALTGHVSKKHLASMLASNSSMHSHDHHAVHKNDEGAFKCTYPGCSKSFTYKHVRDEHAATHDGGNRMFCPICKVYLNGEGSNFKRHMATHRPKHQHMLCRFHGLGCKKRFPRLDNLRRHEASCKFGKKLRSENPDAVVHHHHHHHVHT